MQEIFTKEQRRSGLYTATELFLLMRKKRFPLEKLLIYPLCDYTTQKKGWR